MVIASVVMALGLYGAKSLMHGWLESGFWPKATATAVLVGFGATIYGLGVLLLKVTSVEEMKSAFRR